MNKLGFGTRYFALLFFTLFILSNCHDNNSYSISIAERLLDSRPDSALVLLESLDFPEDMPEREYAKYCQLLVSAHQKNKITIKEDTFIINAVNYYKGLNKAKEEYAKSLLLLGCVYEEQDSIQKAELCYREVYELSVQLENKELHGVSAFEIGGLYKYTGKYEQSIEWFNIAVESFRENDNQRMKRRSMRQIADCYVLLGNTDTALLLYNTVLSEIPLQRQNVKADIYKNMAITYKNAKYYDESLHFLKKSIETTDKESLYPIQYLILASIFQDIGKIDSAVYYNRIALQYAKKQNDLGMIHSAYDALLDTNLPKCFDNYILSRSISDSIYQKQKYESVKFQKLYNIEKIKKRNKELIIRIQCYIFLFSVILLGAVVFYLYQRNMKKKKQLSLTKEIDIKNNIIHTIRNSLFQKLVIYRRMVQLSISPNKEKHKDFLKE